MNKLQTFINFYRIRRGTKNNIDPCGIIEQENLKEPINEAIKKLVDSEIAEIMGLNTA